MPAAYLADKTPNTGAGQTSIYDILHYNNENIILHHSRLGSLIVCLPRYLALTGTSSSFSRKVVFFCRDYDLSVRISAVYTCLLLVVIVSTPASLK